MSDLVEHLRRQASKQDMLTCEDMLQAADEIARLRTALQKIINPTISPLHHDYIARQALEQKAHAE